MNRAALAARLFLGAVLVPIAGAAGFAAYEFRVQPPIPPGVYHEGGPSAPLVLASPVKSGFVLGTYDPRSTAVTTTAVANPAARKPPTGDLAAGVEAFDSAVGAQATLAVRYAFWGQTFPGWYVIAAAKHSAETVLELEPRGKHAPTLRQIASGAGDIWLKKFASEIIGPDDHFILSFAPEMNGQWYTYGNSHAPAADYIAAFRHVHDTLLKDLAKDLGNMRAARRLVTFMWQPSAIHLTTPSPMPYWPGSRYVDEVGVDGYYFFPSDTFGVIFGHTLALIRDVDPEVPMMIGETAVGPKTGHQAADIRNLFAGIRRNHLLGLIWFNKPQHRRPYIYHQDWRLQDHMAAEQAFVAELKAMGQPVETFVEPGHRS